MQTVREGRGRSPSGDWREQKLPEDLEREARNAFTVMQKIRESSHFTREPSDSLCYDLKVRASTSALPIVHNPPVLRVAHRVGQATVEPRL